ncbi:MAG: hypothetical protein JJU12_04145 [Chlamydiales bacterium]|nr:hypothetical protein [Chlamydiales bacterium]
MTQNTTFYLNENLHGHFLLAPSIWVGKSYGRIFSPIKESGCAAFAEFIQRIALFIILPLAALLSAFLIPFGLAVKGLSLCCCPPIHNYPLNNGGKNHCSPPNTTNTLQPRRFWKKQESPSTKENAAWTTLKNVRKKLEEIDRRDINPNKLTNIRKELNDEKVLQVLAEAPTETTTTSHPLDSFFEEHQMLLLWVNSLQFHYDYFEKAIQEGEVEVKDNGDCLFEASRYVSEINGSNINDPQLERDQTVKWMRENYENNKDLQCHLVNSMIEHFLSKIERLEDDRQGLLTIEPSEEITMEEITTRLKEIRKRIETIETNYIPAFTEAMGDTHKDEFHFEPAHKYVEEYFNEMSLNGTFAGKAELYALSCRHKVCFKIHAKGAQSVDAVPYITFNPEFETAERPARHFTHSRNHYNPYFPPSK